MDSTKRWPRPADEAARVAALHELGVLDRPHDTDLEAVTRVAAHVCRVPTAAVNLIDEDRQWQAAAYGTEPGEVPRDDSMCGWSILSREVTYIQDASRDGVFAENPFVTGRLGSVRLYVSAPVVLDTGHVVGTLCAFDTQAHSLTRDQLDRLADLATTAARILELRRASAAMARAATTDPLTGVRNRVFLEETLRRSLDLHGRGVSAPGLLYLDLDRFKPINDRYGHTAGDEVLRQVTARLQESVRAADVVARLGGDEFAVLVEEGSPDDLEARLQALASRIQTALLRPFRAGGELVHLGASVGYAVPRRGEDAVRMIARADQAMYARKRAGRASSDDR